MSKKILQALTLTLVAASASTAAAAPTYFTTTIDWTGYAVDSGYWIKTPGVGGLTCEDNRVYFDKYVNNSGVLTNHSAAAIDQMLRLATGAHLAGKNIRLGIERSGTKCYTRQVFMIP